MEAPMTTLSTLKQIMTNSADTLIQDALGAAALVVILVVLNPAIKKLDKANFQSSTSSEGMKSVK